MMLRYARPAGAAPADDPRAGPDAEAQLVLGQPGNPIPARIARPLIEGLRNEVVVRDPQPAKAFAITPVSYEQAVALAIGRSNVRKWATKWSIRSAPRAGSRSIRYEFEGGDVHRPAGPTNGGALRPKYTAPSPGSAVFRLALRERAVAAPRARRPAGWRGRHAPGRRDPEPVALGGRSRLVAGRGVRRPKQFGSARKCGSRPGLA